MRPLRSGAQTTAQGIPMSDPRSSLIDQIQAAEARATPGPWKVDVEVDGPASRTRIMARTKWGYRGKSYEAHVASTASHCGRPAVPFDHRPANADLLCLLRNHVPEILEALKFRRAALLAMKQEWTPESAAALLSAHLFESAQREAPPHE